MRPGIAALVAAFVLSQFYRAFLAVLAPSLRADLGADPSTLSLASGLWFLVFAAMQIPVGALLDRVGPRRTSALLFALGGGGGAALMALATAPWQVLAAMSLIGAGCAPVLVSAYYIFAKVYPPRVFATLAGAMIGVGSLGNILSSAPLSWAVEEWGWRQALGGLAVVTLLVALALGLLMRDPPASEDDRSGSVLDVLRLRALWPLLPLLLALYAPSAGIRGLWAGPYAESVFGAGPQAIGTVTLVMGLAMVAGNFAYGNADRLLGTRKTVALAGNAVGLFALTALALGLAGSLTAATALFAVVGFFGASFPLVLAHGRSFVPEHLTGRGVTLLNLFGIGGVGVGQFATGAIYDGVAGSGSEAAAYQAIFLAFALALAVGMACYAFSRDRTD